VLLSHRIHSSGVRLDGASAHGESPLTIPLMIFMTTQKPKNWVKSGDWTDIHARPPINIDWI